MKSEPLRFRMAPRAEREFEELVNWLASLSEEDGLRFVHAFTDATKNLCQETAEQIVSGGRPAGLIDEVGSLAFSQPVKQHIFTTQKKRVRRSSSGKYRLYYTLLDEDNDGAVDTLSLLSVCHAASRPVWDMDDSGNE